MSNLYTEHINNYAKKLGLHQLNIKAALIDMDGVLYDSMKYHTIAWQRLATDLGIDATREEFYLYEGMTGAATINLLFNRAFGKSVDAEEAKRLYAIKAKYFTEIGEVEMMPYADKMLNILRDNGIDRVLVTGSGQASILERLSIDYPEIFDEDKRVTAHDVTNGKPHPEPYLKGIEKTKCKPHECIVIENAPLGVQAGKAAGCFTIGITTGPIPQEEMYKAGANIVFSSMKQFAEELPELLSTLRVTNI